MRGRLILILLTVVLAMGMGSLIASTGYALGKGVVLYLKFDEGAGDIAKDSSGKGNDGKLVNKPIWEKGKSGRGILFKGKDNYVEIPNVLGDKGTIEFWFKPNWDGGDDKSYRLFDATFGSIYFFIGKGAEHQDFPNTEMGFYFEDASDADWQNVDVDVTDVVKAGEWYHLAATWEYNGGTAAFYINGEQVAAPPKKTGATPNLNPNPRIGLSATNYIAAANSAEGVIDEFVIYDRALSADEIKADMESTALAVDPQDKIATVWGRIKAE
jgi:arabinan endo-1,5-alpha-L-arabinosidase